MMIMYAPCVLHICTSAPLADPARRFLPAPSPAFSLSTFISFDCKTGKFLTSQRNRGPSTPLSTTPRAGSEPTLCAFSGRRWLAFGDGGASSPPSLTSTRCRSIPSGWAQIPAYCSPTPALAVPTAQSADCPFRICAEQKKKTGKAIRPSGVPALFILQPEICPRRCSSDASPPWLP